MSDAKFAWDAFMRVLAQITEASREGASSDDIHGLFQDARELLQIVEEEIENEPQEVRPALRSALSTMRTRLEALDRDVEPPKH
jgi:ElaB/YqjD/DUF883 family membrane-anchored ribosome-binding protein